MSSFLEILYTLYFKNEKVGLILEVFKVKDNHVKLYTEEIFGYPFLDPKCKLLGTSKEYLNELNNSGCSLNNWDSKRISDILLYLNKEKDNTPFGILKIEFFDSTVGTTKFQRNFDVLKLKELLCNVDKNVFDFKTLQKIIYEYRISFSLLDSYRIDFAVSQLNLQSINFKINKN